MKKVVLFVAVLMFAGAVTISAQEAKLEVALAGNASFTFGINLDAVDPYDTDGLTDSGTTARSVATGISNALENKATLTILAAADYEKGGKEGEEVYGWIKLRQVAIKGEIDQTADFGDNDHSSPVNVTVRNVEAKLFLGPVYINVLGADNIIDKVASTKELWSKNSAAYAFDAASEFGGVAVGLKDESVISLVVGLASRYDFTNSNAAAASTYTLKSVATGYELATGEAFVAGTVTVDADADGNLEATANNSLVLVPTTAAVTDKGINVFNDYTLFAGIGLKAVPGLTLDVSAVNSHETFLTVLGVLNNKNVYIAADTIGLGAKLGYSLAIAEGFALNPWVGLDFASGTSFYSDASIVIPSVEKTVSTLQFVGGLNFTVPGTFLDEWDAFGKGIDAADGIDINPGLTAVFAYKTVTDSYFADIGTDQADPTADLAVYFYDADLIPVLNLIAAVEITNLTADVTEAGHGTQTFGWGVYAEAVLDQLKPWAKYFTVAATAYDATENAGVAVVTTQTLAFGVDITVITNTTFSISYENSGLNKIVTVAGEDKSNADVGTIKFTTKISY